MKNIKNLDLNLLVVLDELLRERNTVRAAQKLGLSQPAVSHALKRLRDAFEDPLLVRVSKGLMPTRKALSLEPKVRQLLENVEGLISNEEAFDPGKARITFRVASTDMFKQIYLARLLAVFSKEAPHCTLIVRPTPGKLPHSELIDGSLDLAIAGFYGE